MRESDTRESPGDDGGFFSGEDEGTQVDMATFELSIDESGMCGELDRRFS